MRPLRIRAYLQDGRVAGVDPWFPLDSILAYAYMLANYPHKLYSDSLLLDLLPDLPLQKRGKGDDWYWACSFNVAKPIGEYVTYWHKRFDDHYEKYLDFCGRCGRVSTVSGKYRSYRMPLVIQLFDYLEWFAFGDPDAIMGLCRFISHIGKKTSQGYGAVERWEFQSTKEDWSENRGSELTRPVPASLAPPDAQGILTECGIRPPYWYTGNWRLCLWKEE
ncbi:MAG: hypothetical protein ACUVSK_06500 [Desulfotomaculales bacterium]